MRRILSVALALVLLVGLIPAAAVTAFAAENSISEDMIAAIKELEGFHEKAYKDNTQWTIGYGTKSKEGETITREEADKRLREELEAIDELVNKFATSKNLTLSQGQHDALVSFSFNCGTAWMNANGKFRDAVVNGTKGNDFLYAICLWSNSGSQLSTGLLNRRLAEASRYFGGAASAKAPSNYTYVIFDGNGGSVGENKAQGYDSSTQNGVAIKAVPTRENYLFTGWYTEKDGGKLVSALTKDTAGKTLYAQWMQSVTVTVTNSYVNIRKQPSTAATSAIVGRLNMGDQLVLFEISADGKWGHFEDGWVALEYTNYKEIVGGDEDKEEDSAGKEPVVATGTVTSSTHLKIRKGPSTSTAQVGYLTTGTKVSIYEITKAGGHDWGRIDQGWICLTYVKLGDDSTEDKEEPATIQGTVNSANGLNVFEKADADSKIVEVLKNGTKITITETQTVSGQQWGKTDNGWVLMTLVKVDGTVTNYRLGKVANTNTVNIRAAAGTNSALVTTLKRGVQVRIYSETTKNGVKWYKIDQGWVCGTYITLEDGAQIPTETPKEDTPATGVIATGLVTSRADLNVRKGPGTTYEKVDSLPTNTKVNIYEKTKVNGTEWGRIDEGWVCMTYIYITSTTGTTTTPDDKEDTPSGQGTKGTVVNCSAAVNIRAAAGTNNALVGSAALGSTVTIYETTTVNGIQWGRMDKGWVCMTYIKLQQSADGNTGTGSTGTGSTGSTGSTDSTGTTGTNRTGTITNTNNVNIRSAAGVRNALVTTLARGTKVTVYEQVTKDGAAWGRIDQGWVAMQYVALDAASGSTGNTGNNGNTGNTGDTGGNTGSTGGNTGSTGTAIGSGYVSSSADLNVRTGPGLSYAKTTSLAKGTQVTVYEQKLSDGMIWGRIDQGWVCMSYVTMTSSNTTGQGEMGTIARCGRAVNVRSAPGTGNALLGTILVGTRVEILETKDYNGQEWGRVTQGWISMYYVLLDSELPPVPAASNP